MSSKEADVHWQLFWWLTHHHRTHTHTRLLTEQQHCERNQNWAVSHKKVNQPKNTHDTSNSGFGGFTLCCHGIEPVTLSTFEQGHGLGKERREKKIGWALWLVDESPPNIKQMTACVQRITFLSYIHTQKRIWKANFENSNNSSWQIGSLFPHNALGRAWTQMGVVLLQIYAPFFPFSFLISAAKQTSQREKKNQFNYSSNYLIISLCCGEQEGEWRWSLCFLSSSVLRSRWRHLEIFQYMSITFLHWPYGFWSSCADFASSASFI